MFEPLPSLLCRDEQGWELSQQLNIKKTPNNFEGLSGLKGANL